MGAVTHKPGAILLDWAYGTPNYDLMLDPAGPVKAAGIIRYVDSIDPTNPKSVQQRDVDACRKWHASLTLVHERSSIDPLILDGAVAGKRAREIAVQRVPGYAPWAPVIAAEDTDLTSGPTGTLGTGVNYFALFVHAGGPAGPYGEFDLIESCHQALIPSACHWQTQAWSGGRVSTQAHVLQLIHPTVDLSPVGITVDQNTVLRPLTLWTPADTGAAPTMGLTRRISKIKGRNATFYADWQTSEVTSIDLCLNLWWIDGNDPEQVDQLRQDGPHLRTTPDIDPAALGGITLDRIPTRGSDGAHDWDPEATRKEFGTVLADKLGAGGIGPAGPPGAPGTPGPEGPEGPVGPPGSGVPFAGDFTLKFPITLMPVLAEP